MKRGDYFTHKFWLNPDKTPMRCIVTKVAQGCVYYQPANGGKTAYFPIEQSTRYIA